MNHAPEGEKECECWECLCVGRALVRVTSRSCAPAATTAAAAPALETSFLGARIGSIKLFLVAYVLFPK